MRLKNSAQAHRRLSYPGIEAKYLYGNLSLRIQKLSKSKPPITRIDLLEIESTPEGKVIWREALDHDALIDHFEGPASSDTVTPPVLRMLFVDSVGSTTDNVGLPDGAQLHPSTITWMADHFSVSPVFIHALKVGRTLQTFGSSSFSKTDDNGDVSVLSGFYGTCWNAGLVWFSHDLKMRTSTYIVFNCRGDVKDLILRCAREDHADSLGGLCTIDCLIVDALGTRLGDNITKFRDQVLKYERMRTGLERLSSQDMSQAVEELHHSSQELHIISQNLVDLGDTIEFLCELHKRYMSYRPVVENTSAVDSLRFTARRTKMVRGWVENFINRADIRINLFYNLAAQRDNPTNLDISKSTAKISIETQRDSSSMITIAAVTMFFLPGTFVSALFSMVFFNFGTDSSGRVALTVAPQWWYFIAITIPLTIVVFLVWILWQRWRNKAKGIGKAEDGSSDEMV